jgi:hypothetical protein
MQPGDDRDDPYDFVLREALITRSAQRHGPTRESMSAFVRTECCGAPIYLAERVVLRLATVVRCASCRRSVWDCDDDVADYMDRMTIS